MADANLPISETLSSGIAHLVFARPDWSDDDDVVMNETTPMDDVLADAEDARLHVAALLGILSKCHPAYKIESGLFFGNLQPIHARLERLIDGLNAMNHI
jgi:hypothetical protein